MIVSNLSEYTCLTPSTIEEALAQKAEIDGLAPIAGGTEVMVLMNEGKAPWKNLQSLHRLRKEWRYVATAEDGGLRIGALATYTDVRHHSHVKAHYPLLVEAARVTGALQIQNLGTLAGNVVNGSPAADAVPPLMVYDAKLRLVSRAGERIVELASFHTGYRKNILRADELLAEIILPPVQFVASSQYYLKVGTRAAQAISKVVFAAARQDGVVRISIGSVAPTTLRALRTERIVAEGASAEDAWKILDGEIKPIDDVRSTAMYRRQVSRRILREFLDRTAHPAAG